MEKKIRAVMMVAAIAIVAGANMFNSQRTVDMSDIASCPAFPDIDSFNDLDSQLRAGVPLKRVNTNVLHQDDVAEVNSLCESVINNVELVKSNENEN